MTYTIELRQETGQPKLSIRGKVTFAEIGEKVGEFVAETSAYLERLGIEPDGPPFTRVHGLSPDHIDLEAGLTIRRPIQGEARIESGVLPDGPVAFTLHRGDYQTLPEANEAILNWANANGWQANGPNWERHMVAPGHDPNPENWRTEVVMPLKKA